MQFETGGSSVYDGSGIVARSIDLGHPILFVSFNYRLGAFGWLGGKEVKEAGIGNLGLHDQRFAAKKHHSHTIEQIRPSVLTVECLG